MFALVGAATAANGAVAAGVQQPRSTLMLRLATQSSTNWAGYAVTSPDPAAPSTFTSVSASWTQPEATCGEKDGISSSSMWVGIGGYGNSAAALEQIGTGADCNPSGPSSYYAWYELVPDPPVSFAMKIKPGDVISTSVKVKGNFVTLQITNRTRGTVAADRALDHSLDLSSAEWIAEAPSTCWAGSSCSPLPLADFGSLKFSGITATGNGHAGTISDPAWANVPIQLVPTAANQQSGSPATSAGTCAPSQLDPNGRSFAVSWISVAALGGC